MTANLPRDLLKGWRILVIDDDGPSLTVATIILGHYGAVVSTAADGEQGLALAKSLQPKFIIADLSMPVMDGWTMINKLKDDRATADIPVVALTAHAMRGDREKAISAGFHNYLTKPLTPSTFMNDLLRVLSDIPALAILPVQPESEKHEAATGGTKS